MLYDIGKGICYIQIEKFFKLILSVPWKIAAIVLYSHYFWVLLKISGSCNQFSFEPNRMTHLYLQTTSVFWGQQMSY